jgi:hypothetical protein
MTSTAEAPAAAPEASGPDPQLLALEREVAADLAGEGTTQLSGVPGAPAVPLERELAGMFAMLGAGAGQFLPSVRAVLDEPTCKSLGDVLAPLARKYGLDRYLAGFQWRLELQALFVVVPVALALKEAIARDLAKATAAAGAGGLGAEAAGPSASSSAPAPTEKPPLLRPVT